MARPQEASPMPAHRYPGLATDIIIEYTDGRDEGIVLIDRKYAPLGTAIPGGKAEVGLTLEENAIKEALEETGLHVELYNPEQPLCVHSRPDRDPREHMVSVTYVGRGTGTIRSGSDARAARLYTIPHVRRLLAHNGLCFDHYRALKKYMDGRDTCEDAPETYWRRRYNYRGAA